ncbi:hypothetical protein H6G76_32930 [Nostoc sp. FACHB-152]|uniref:hypothetical protein n=1 Tax=Nostoc sp. FACHB-152 TaxID=2692837 RepID=UPI001686794C|nr:hypothetical protein [Nostoc sp. FACHB-152]MBD2451842.1 hypothetical protein [Nostoc sp. FACHB-152]
MPGDAINGHSLISALKPEKCVCLPPGKQLHISYVLKASLNFCECVVGIHNVLFVKTKAIARVWTTTAIAFPSSSKEFYYALRNTDRASPTC